MRALLAAALLCGCMHVGGSAKADEAEDERQADYARGMEVYKANQKALADWHDGEKQRAAAAEASPYANDEPWAPTEDEKAAAAQPPPPPPRESRIDTLRRLYSKPRSTPQRQRDADYILRVFAETLSDPAAYGRKMYLDLGVLTVVSDSEYAMRPENINKPRVDLCRPELHLWNAADNEGMFGTASASRDLKSNKRGICLDGRILKHFGTYQKALDALHAK